MSFQEQIANLLMFRNLMAPYWNYFATCICVMNCWWFVKFSWT